MSHLRHLGRVRRGPGLHPKLEKCRGIGGRAVEGARVDATPGSLRPEEASGTQKARYEAAETAASPVEMTEGKKGKN